MGALSGKAPATAERASSEIQIAAVAPTVSDPVVAALTAQVALLERELADAKNEKNRLLGLLEQKSIINQSLRLTLWQWLKS